MSKVGMILNMVSLQRKLIVKAAHMSVRRISISGALRKNYYDILGLPRNATQAEIKKAYFELSKLYHPDRIAATDETLSKFREVSTAYEILGNEQSRQLYDSGLIGEIKLGVDERDEVVDPIIKFYKERQEASKFHAGEEMEAWAQTYFRDAKKRASKKLELYQQSEREEQKEEDETLKYFFQVAVGTVLCMLTAASFNNSRFDMCLKQIASLF